MMSRTAQSVVMLCKSRAMSGFTASAESTAVGRVAQAFAEVIDDLDAEPSEGIGAIPLAWSEAIGRMLWQRVANPS